MYQKGAAILVVCAILTSAAAAQLGMMPSDWNETGPSGPEPSPGPASTRSGGFSEGFAEKTLEIRGYPGVVNADPARSQAVARDSVRIDHDEDGRDVEARVDLTEGSRKTFEWLTVSNLMRDFCADVTWNLEGDRSDGIASLPELDVLRDGLVMFTVRGGSLLSPATASFRLHPGEFVTVTVSLFTDRDTEAGLRFTEDYERAECDPAEPEPECSDWSITVTMRWAGRTYSSLVLQARTENAIYRWGSDGYYDNLFLDEWDPSFREQYSVEFFGSWGEDTNWHTFGMRAVGDTLILSLDGVDVRTYAPERGVTALQAVQLRAGWIATAEVDHVIVDGTACGFLDAMAYGSLADAEAAGWDLLEGQGLALSPDMVSGTGSSLVLDNDGGRGALIERTC